MQQIKQRSKLTATFLALISLIFLPGIGQVFGGRLCRAFLLLGILCVVALCYAAGGMNYLYTAIVLYAAIFILWIYIAYDAYKLNSKKNGIKLHWYNKWYFYIVFAIVFGVLSYFNQALFTGYSHFRIMNKNNAPSLQAGDIVMAKMNYGHLSGFFTTEVNTNPYSHAKQIPVIIFSSPKYTVGSFIFFKMPDSSDENNMFIAKIVAIGGETFTSKTGVIKVPQNEVLISIATGDIGLIPIKDIQGKALYVMWSQSKSRIGLRLD